MQLADVPLLLMLVGLAAYVVLGGADFGAGFWQLWGGSGDRDRAIRDHSHHAMGPVWETNHVWLIFVLVVCWTAYPTAFASIASTLCIPLFIAGVGIILRGTAYALRSGTESAREQRRVEIAFAISSILTPFALGAVVGGIASGRVPVGNAAGNLWSSWLNWTSAFVGVLGVSTAAYLAAVYLAADAVRTGHRDLAGAFRARALGAGVVAGALAVVGLPVVHHDAPGLWDGLTSGAGLAAVVVSGVAGIVTLALVFRSGFEPARLTAAVAVAAIIAGWALAQRPQFLPGLTIDQAAAGHNTLIAVVVAAVIAVVVLGPSLALLFSLFLHGRFDPHTVEGAEPAGAPARRWLAAPRLAALAGACFVVGATLTFFLDDSWAHAVGVTALLTCVGLGFVAIGWLVAESSDRNAG
jgi:cytochrome d ubiquinol oxidase subunit II